MRPLVSGALRSAAALVAGGVLGASSIAAGALLLYTGEGFMASAGFLIALTFVSAAAGLWVGAPDGPLPGHRRMLGRWMFAVVALVVASFVASWLIRSPWLQASRPGGALALVLLLAEPSYAIGALLGALEARRRGWLTERWLAERAERARRRVSASAAGERRPARGGAIAVPALLGIAGGVVMATYWLIPALPPGPGFLGGALLLALAGSVEMSLAGDPKEGAMRDRVVVVTGVGDRGQVGYAVAEAFVALGANVVITGRSETVHERARDLGAVAGVAADLTDPAGAQRVVDEVRGRYDRMDALINVAGGLRVARPVSETTPEEWQREVDANARTAFLMTRAALPLLREARGAVVNFASPAGERAVKGMAAYSAAKAGVVALTRAVALEERDSGVRVNAVAPGMVDTAQNRADAEDPSRVRWVTREQVVELVLFLVGEGSSGVNGQVIGLPG